MEAEWRSWRRYAPKPGMPRESWRLPGAGRGKEDSFWKLGGKAAAQRLDSGFLASGPPDVATQMVAICDRIPRKPIFIRDNK